MERRLDARRVRTRCLARASGGAGAAAALSHLGLPTELPPGAGTPALDTTPSAQPALGSAFPLRLTPLPAGVGAALLGFGFDLSRWNGAILPLALDPVGLPGCRVWVGVDAALVVLTHSGNAVTYMLAVPANPALAGLIVGAQALVLDAAHRPGSLRSPTARS